MAGTLRNRNLQRDAAPIILPMRLWRKGRISLPQQIGIYGDKNEKIL